MNLNQNQFQLKNNNRWLNPLSVLGFWFVSFWDAWLFWTLLFTLGSKLEHI